MYSVALTMTYLAAENENKKLKGLSQNDFARVPKNILSVAEEKVTIREFCKLKVTPTVCFCNDSTHFLHLEPYCQCT